MVSDSAPLPGLNTRRRIGLRILIVLGIGLLAWLVGLIGFAAALPRQVPDETQRTDAIVVLTGGSGRVSQGLGLLVARLADKIFISGVYRGVDVQELLRVSQQSPSELACCVALGYEADSTRGNALETAAWMREQGFTSLRLVTSAYHMPRSLLEFRRVMPELTILPHPVFPENVKQRDWWLHPGSASLLAQEYSKYLVALLRGLVDGGPAAAAPERAQP